MMLGTLFICFWLLKLVLSKVIDSRLTGTWSTKSNSTITGPNFYNPQRDRLLEPYHTGISYSFTDDGYYESAWYRSIANPVEPACPKTIMQWQHGSFRKFGNGSLALTPIASDGRQLTSDPCVSKTSIYFRYNQSEVFKWYETLLDPYHQLPRLNLYQFDGSPIPVLYLVSRMPIMLPTTTLYASTSGVKATGTVKHRKRFNEADQPPALQNGESVVLRSDAWWWCGISLITLGTVIYLCSYWITFLQTWPS